MLSDSPSGMTLQYAEKLLNPQESTSEKNTGPSWNDIIMEEPFTGQHWQGAYGLPDGAVVKSWDDSGSDIDYTRHYPRQVITSFPYRTRTSHRAQETQRMKQILKSRVTTIQNRIGILSGPCNYGPN